MLDKNITEEVRKMKIYELTLKVYLLQDFPYEKSLEKVGELIDKTLISDETFFKLHNANEYKNYTFNSLYKLEKDKVYKEGNIYSIKIRTADAKLEQFLKENLANTYTKYIKGLTIESEVLKKRYIEKIYSITPNIIKTDQGYWKGNLSLTEYEKRLRENLIKKYNKYYNTKLDENFELFHRIEFSNKKPISCAYKDIKLLADKLSIYIAENETAQKLAYFALGVGLGEMNSRGYGFINYKLL